MYTSSITQKGQVTIPAELREALGIHTGDIIGFVRKKNHIEITKLKSSIKESFGIIKAKHGVSLDEIKKGIIAGATDDNS